MKKTNLILVLIVLTGALLATNNALDFDGANEQYISSNFNTDLATWTIECWVKGDAVPSSASYDGVITRGYNFQINWDHENVDFRGAVGIYVGSSWYAASFGTLEGNIWYHLAGTYDGEDLKAYKNGVLMAVNGSPSGAAASSTDVLLLGAKAGPSAFFDGQLDEVRIWSDVRTETEIRGNMYQELVGNETNLIVYYNLNETSGTTADNLEGTATYDGTLTSMAGTEWFTSPAFFGPKNCLDFDGSNDYVLIPPDASLNNDTFSVEFWVKFDDTPTNWDGIIDKGRYSQSEDWTFLTHQSALIVIFQIPGAQLWIGISDNNWHHIAGTFDGANMIAYLDGVESSTTTGSYTSTTNGIQLGKTFVSNYYFNGYLDEVRIWSDAHTATEIAENMCKSLTGNESGLVAYYNFDNTSGTILQDFSGNENDGTINSTPVWSTSTAFNTWLNTDDTDWTTDSNWSSGSTPVSTDNVGIYDYAGGTSPALSGTPTVNNLVVGSTSDLTLGSNATVNGNLFLYDDLDLNGQTITLGITSTLYEDSGNIFGTSGTIQTTRDLGSPNADNVAGLGAIITDTDRDLGETTIIRGHEAQGSQGIKRYYQITTENDPTSATLVFNYLDAELNDVTEANMKLFKSSGGVDWTVQNSSSVNTIDKTITLSGIDSFSWWTAGDGDGPLPVNLSAFYALYVGGVPTLYWTTQTENNNAYWNVYRGTNNDFSTAYILNDDDPVPGNGTTDTPSDYVYIDAMPVVQNTTYRYWIEDVSTDGETELHDPITLFIPYEDTPITPESYGLQQNYPNPFNPSTAISFTLKEDSDVELTIYNVKGAIIRTIFNEHVYADQINTLIWDGNNADGKQVSSGVYFYKLITDTKEYQKKMLLVK